MTRTKQEEKKKVRLLMPTEMKSPIPALKAMKAKAAGVMSAIELPEGEDEFSSDDDYSDDDILSIGALSAIRERGLEPAKDIGVIGLNDMEIARWESVDLTTIRQPIEPIVTSSVDLIEEILLLL